MDVEPAIIAEKLKSKMSYLSSHKNDQRTANEFLNRMVADGKKCLKIKNPHEYVINESGLDSLEKANNTLLAWGNMASHSHDVVKVEASELIHLCEQAIDVFQCDKCTKPIWKLSADDYVQCECGEIRWKFI